MNPLIPFLLLTGRTKAERAASLAHLLPAVMPVGGDQRFMLAALTADQQARREARTERRLVEEVVTAFVKAGQVSKPEDLAQFPALQGAFNRLPASAQGQLFPSDASKSHGDGRTAATDRTAIRGTPART